MATTTGARVLAIFGLAAITGYVSARLGFEKMSPMIRIDRFLADKTRVSDPETNFKLAEQYRELEEKSDRKNDKLLSALNIFLELRKVTEPSYCNNRGYDILEEFTGNMVSHVHKFKHLPLVYEEILKSRGAACRQEFYQALDEKLEQVPKKVENQIKSIFFDDFIDPLRNMPGNFLTFTNGLFDGIISKNPKTMLNYVHVKKVYDKCEVQFPAAKKDERIEVGILKPCEAYMDKVKDVFRSTDKIGMQPETGEAVEASPETQHFYTYWALYRLCQAFGERGLVAIKKDLQSARVSCS